jgi:hypothetical protein
VSDMTSSAAAPTGDGGAAASGPEVTGADAAAPAGEGKASGTQGVQSSIPASGEMKQTLGETKAQADARRKFKFKVDGAEIEEELSDNDVHVRLQKAMAVEKRFQEVASQRKQIEDALKTIKSDPAKALKELAGIDLDEWAEQRLTERYNEAMMPEQEREMAALKRQLAQYEAAAEEQKASAQKAQLQAFEQQVYEQTQAEFIKAIDTLGYDKEFSRTVVLPIMAEIAEQALDYGVELTPEQLASEANKRLETIHQKQIKAMSGESLLRYLGDDVVKQIIRSKLGATKTAAPPPPAPAAREPRPSANKPKSLADFRMKHLYGVE